MQNNIKKERPADVPLIGLLTDLVELQGHSALAVSSRVLVQNTLGDSLIDLLDRNLVRAIGLGAIAFSGSHLELLDGGLQLGLRSLVARVADLTDENASSGNSVLAVTQQLSISLGVAVSAAVLRFYEGFDGTNTVEQFHYTFITMGALTVVSAVVFMLLKPKDGRNLIKERHKEKAKPNRVPSEQE